MGFFGSLISEALSSGIKKGLGNAIGKAVENIVKPSVEKYAQQHADQIDAASQTLQQTTSEMRESLIEETRKKMTEQDYKVLEEFKQKLPQYPVWNVGGYEFELEYRGEQEGFPMYTLKLLGPAFLLDLYKQEILKAGFQYLGGPYSDVMSKMIDGKCFCFTTTDAIQDENIWVNYFVDEEYKPKQ